MNLFLNYHKKFSSYLKKLEKDKIIKLPENMKNLTVELPPKNNVGSISCNAAMILAKSNQKSPMDIADILKKNFLKDFKEFEKIEIAKPGFLNINFTIDFWKDFVIKIIKLNKKYIFVFLKNPIITSVNC